MSKSYIKKNSSFSEVSGYYRKEGGSWVTITQSDLLSYMQQSACIYNGEITFLKFEIAAPSTLTAESCQCLALLDHSVLTSGVQWSIISGSTYASIDSTGLLTINSGADASSIVIGAAYNNYSTEHNIIATYRFGSTSETTSETTVDPSTGETTTTVTTVTENSDGTTTTSQTATTFDEEGNETGHVQTDTDAQGNVDTQTVVKDEDGNDVVTGYTIDTTENPDGGRDITGDGVNTGFYPFDGGEGFELHIRFRSVKTEQPNPPLVTDTEDNGSNLHFTILCCKSPFQPYPGFHIRWTLNKKNYSSGNLVFGYKGSTGSSANRSLAASKNNDVYDFTVAYDPKLKKYPSKFRCIDNLNGGATISLNIDFNSLDYGVTLGYNINQQGQPYRYSNVEIYEFSISKL
jgi:hypothetical protein